MSPLEIMEAVVEELLLWSQGKLANLPRNDRGFCYNFYKLVEDIDDDIQEYLELLYRASWESWEHNTGELAYAVPGSSSRGAFPEIKEDLWGEDKESTFRKGLTRHTAMYILENFDEYELEYEVERCR